MVHSSWADLLRAVVVFLLASSPVLVSQLLLATPVPLHGAFWRATIGDYFLPLRRPGRGAPCPLGRTADRTTCRPGARWRRSVVAASPGRMNTRAMAYDEELAERVRELVQLTDGLSEKRMFGGLAFLVNGNMAVSASGQGGLLLRVDPAQTEALVDEPGAQRFQMRGREMNGWLRVDADASMTDDKLATWVNRGLAYAQALPPK
jgi:TfoX/Sxy family transcriptional regulator of competence genes